MSLLPHHPPATAAFRCLAAAAVLALSAACDREADPTGPSRQITPAAPVLRALSHTRGQEAGFVELAKLVPSAAGFYYDANGRLVVTVADSSDSPRVSAAIAQLKVTKRMAFAAGPLGNAPIFVRRGTAP